MVVLRIFNPENNPSLWEIKRSICFCCFEIDYRAIRKEIRNNYVADFRSRLVYQGYRPSVSLELHLRYGQKVGFNEDS